MASLGRRDLGFGVASGPQRMHAGDRRPVEAARPPTAGKRQVSIHARPVDRLVDRCGDHRRLGLGPDLVGVVPIPPTRDDVAARPGALQPADRGALHDRADHHRRGVLLLHRREARTRSLEERRQPRPLGSGHRAAVVVDLQLSRRGVAADGEDVYDVRHAGRPAGAVAGQGPVGHVQPALARRHPLLLGAVVLLQAGRHPGPRQQLLDDADREGMFAGRCAELCGALPLRMLFKVHVVDQAQYDAHTCKTSTTPARSARRAAATNSSKIAGLEARRRGGDE